MGLPLKQRLFVAYYLGKAKGNGTLAARLAGYGSPTEAASRLLTFAKVKAAIEAKLAEVAMSSDEVLARLSDLAATTAADFSRFDADKSPDRLPALDLRKAKRRGKLASVKKLKAKQAGPDDPAVIVEVELHDAHKALALLAKYHGLLDGKGGEKPAEEKPRRIVIPGADGRPRQGDPG